jgi:hypothetical protein
MFFSLIFAGMVWGQDLAYKDPDFSCIDQATAQRYIQDFSIDTASFGGVELCNSQVDTKKLFNDLQIIEKGQFNFFSNSSNTFIRGFLPANNYYSWMKSQTRGVHRGNDIPTATAYNSGGYFTMQNGWSLSSTLGRVGTVIHEARHTAGYRHVPCAHGPYQDVSMDACDSNYQYSGSHAIEMEYYARVSVLGTNFHPVYKAMARLMGIARSNFVFNQPIIQKKEAILALNQNGAQADLFVDGQVISRDVPQVQGVMKRTSFGASIFDGTQAYSIELYGKNHLNDTIKDGYSYYKLMDRNPSQLFDFEEFDVDTKRYVTQMKSNSFLQFFTFSKGDWTRGEPLSIQVARSATHLSNGQTGYFLIDTQGTIYPVNVQTQSLDQALNFKWDPSHVEIADNNGTTLILKTDGLIYERQSNGSENIWPLAKGHYISLINAPIYDGFVVER